MVYARNYARYDGCNKDVQSIIGNSVSPKEMKEGIGTDRTRYSFVLNVSSKSGDRGSYHLYILGAITDSIS